MTPKPTSMRIALGWHFYESLGLREITLLLNSLGDPT